MTRDEQLAVLWQAQCLVGDVQSLASRTASEVTLRQLAAPIARADAIGQGLNRLRDEIVREAYLTGESAVAIDMRGSGEFFIAAADEDGPLRVVDRRFGTREEAEEYATSHGMRLFVGETANAA